MPGPDDPRPLLSTVDETAVRARLAEARHTDPVPDSVVARLDAVLRDLAGERRAEAPAAPVTPVVPRAARRRHGLATGLVAAAAVVALGVALPGLLDGADHGAGGTAGSTADDRGSSAGADAPAAAERGSTESTPAGGVALSSTERLRPAVRALLRTDPAATYDAGAACALDVGPGRRLGATWDGLPAVLVLRPVRAGRRGVDVYVCGSDEVVGRTTLPAR